MRNNEQTAQETRTGRQSSAHFHLRISTVLAAIAAIAAHANASQNYWYTAPTVTVANLTYSMPGAASGGSFYVVVSDSTLGASCHERVYRRMNNAWTNCGCPWYYGGVSLLAPVMTANGPMVGTWQSPGNKVSYWDSVLHSPGTFTSTNQWPYSYHALSQSSQIASSAYNISLRFDGANSTGAANLQYTTNPFGGSVVDVAVTSSDIAYVIDGAYNLWIAWKSTSGGLLNQNLNYWFLGAMPSGQNPVSVGAAPGYGNAEIADTAGMVWEYCNWTGATPLGKPTTFGAWSTPTAFDGGRHYVFVAADVNASGSQQLYVRPYNWGTASWQTWQGPYALPGGRSIVGSPVLDSQSKTILVLDNTGHYWRGGWNLYETAWTWTAAG